MPGRDADDIPEYSDADLSATATNELAELRRLLHPAEASSGGVGDDLDALRELLVTVERNSELTQLRGLLLGPEQEQLANLRQRVEDPGPRTADVAEVLAEALVLRASQDKKLMKALAPTVAEALNISIKKDPKVLINVLFPIIGSMIRKALTATLGGMLQSLNQTLEHSFSVQGLKWRLEARATGKPFAEVVLLKTLVYQVEQVFLIHKQTGLLLGQAARNPETARDADLISGMLTAIQDFVHDSFRVEQGDALETMRVGDVNVWIEQGPMGVLAVVIRGNAPSEIRSALADAVEGVHFEFGEALERFQGDAAELAGVQPYLDSCLLAQYGNHRPAEKTGFKLHPALAAGLLVLGLGLVVWWAWGWWETRQWDAYLSRLRTEPGLVVTTVERRGGRMAVTGLRDPLAVDPQTLLVPYGINPQKVEPHWELFQSLDSRLVLKRANLVLTPPPTVTLTMETGVLRAAGVASRTWMLDAERLGRGVAGVSGLDLKQVQDVETAEVAELVTFFENQAVQFDVGVASPRPGQELVLAELARRANRLGELAQVLGRRITLEMTGFTDETGTIATNGRLSQKRAENVRLELIRLGVNPLSLRGQGKGGPAPQDQPRDPASQAFPRRVSFRVVLN